MQQIVFSPFVASRILDMSLYADVDFIHCPSCGQDALPPTKVRGAQVCPHDELILGEAEYQLEMGTTMCHWCDEVLVPALQHSHDCPAITPERLRGSTATG